MKQIIYMFVESKRCLTYLGMSNLEGVPNICECSRFLVQSDSKSRLRRRSFEHRLYGRLLILPRLQSFEPFPCIPQFFQRLSTYPGVWIKKLRPGGLKHCIKIGIPSAKGCTAERLMQNWRACSHDLSVLLQFVH